VENSAVEFHRTSQILTRN